MTPSLSLTAAMLALTPAQPMFDALDAALERTHQNLDEGVGIIVRVDAARWDRPYQSASLDGLDPGAAFRTASNTKTWVAAALLRLHEAGRLDIDASISAYLNADYLSALQSGGYNVDAITLRHLANHTSGLADHAQIDVFFEQIMANQDRVWTRFEQVTLALEHTDKLDEPGGRYSYSDTGYLLIGEIIETITGQALAEALRTLVGYDRLGLNHTWLETAETEPADAPARLPQGALGLSTQNVHASMDLYGGGGLVSTLADMNRFYHALINGDVLETADALEDMMTPTEQSQASSQSYSYGLGLFVHEIGGQTCYGHAGFWGTLAYHCPQSGITISGAVTNQSGNGALTQLIHEAIGIASAPPAASSR